MLVTIMSQVMFVDDVFLLYCTGSMYDGVILILWRQEDALVKVLGSALFLLRWRL